MTEVTESDRRVLDLAQVLAAPIFDHELQRQAVPNATLLELYAALLAVREAIDVRLGELEPHVRKERVQKLGGLN